MQYFTIVLIFTQICTPVKIVFFAKDDHRLPTCVALKETLDPRHLTTFVVTWDAHGVPTCLG